MKPAFIVWHTSAPYFGTASIIRSWHIERGRRDIGYHGVVLNGVLTKEDARRGLRVTWLDVAFEVGRLWDSDGLLEQEEVGAHAYGLNHESRSWADGTRRNPERRGSLRHLRR